MAKIIATFDTEKQLFSEGYDFVIGIDEAGRGPLAGPVVACACALKSFEFIDSKLAPSPVLSTRHPLPSGEEDKYNLIRDSKTLSEKQRESLFDFIYENFYVGVGICDHKTIDRINILEATYLAMKKAVSELFRAYPLPPRVRGTLSQRERRIILVDGNKNIPNLSMEQRAIVSGDKKVKSIAAASIIAKVTRDRIMVEAHEKYPKYEFAKHKGYGTAMHMEKIREFGACEIHRLSFAPFK